ncbi:MAG: radical SAM protein [Candidatus Thermoplasmatota archaeon]|nr:radical SAM protein [Candidatus Thermoplasmatota archaeon]
MDVIREFDPWDGEMCTCPDKYSLNPYTGCGHRCIYCYATYIPNFFEPRRKKDIVDRVEKDLQKIPKGSLISLSNSSDPYLPMDKEHKDTRECLKVLKEHEMRVLIVTKGVHVERDIDILKEMDAAVTVSICTLKEEIKEKLEPNTPSGQERLDLVETLAEEDIPVGVRFDPIFPKVTEEEIPTVVEEVSERGAEHIVSSTFKARGDSWKRFKLAFPDVAKELEELYFEEGKKIDNSYYLPREMRMNILKKVAKECEEYEISFATCREGLPALTTSKSCDGSHLINSKYSIER